MSNSEGHKLSVTERRLLALRNELNGVADFVEGLEEHLKSHPNDKWAEKSLAHYRRRMDELVAQIAEYG